MAGTDAVTLFLCGDVMTGRGIDQILPHPAPPHLYEPVATSARDYVRLAERESGPLPRGVDWDYVWGDALAAFARMRPAARVANLETAVTLSEDAADKGINYRMSPKNLLVLTAAGFDVCTLANNHVLDWGETGLAETLDSLSGAGIAACGAGLDGEAAAAPAEIALPGGGRLLVVALAHGSSGVPESWAAGQHRPGVNRLPDLSERTAATVCDRVAGRAGSGDIVVVSIHWGGNWGFYVTAEQTRFARALIDGGVSVVCGHSSHHAKAIERYRDGLILYGTGDFLNDYEGIGGKPGFRDDLTLMVWPEIERPSGAVGACTLTPLAIRHFRLNAPSAADRRWLADVLGQESAAFGTAVTLREDGWLTVTPAPS